MRNDADVGEYGIDHPNHPNNSEPEETAECSKGWDDRCRQSKTHKCNCACGGANHGKKANWSRKVKP